MAYSVFCMASSAKMKSIIRIETHSLYVSYTIPFIKGGGGVGDNYALDFKKVIAVFLDL